MGILSTYRDAASLRPWRHKSWQLCHCKHHRVDHTGRERPTCFSFQEPLCTSRDTHKDSKRRSSRKERLLGAHKQEKPSQFNHFLSTATSSCAICPTFLFQKRTKRPKPRRIFPRHPGEEGKLHSTMIGCRAHQNSSRFHDPTFCKENPTACHQQSR